MSATKLGVCQGANQDLPGTLGRCRGCALSSHLLPYLLHTCGGEAALPLRVYHPKAPSTVEKNQEKTLPTAPVLADNGLKWDN